MIKDAISASLDRIAADNNVTILMAVESGSGSGSGSRSWGFPSPDSDYDVRFIYAHPKDWYLQVFAQKDVIELDINGWDIKKALGLAAKGNAVIYEWLNAPIVYQTHSRIETALRDAICGGFNLAAAFHHYHSLATKFMAYLSDSPDKVKLKKLFYLLRALLCAQWIVKKRTIPRSCLLN
jgi:predicted nucleotidyltransferase